MPSTRTTTRAQRRSLLSIAKLKRANHLFLPSIRSSVRIDVRRSSIFSMRRRPSCAVKRPCALTLLCHCFRQECICRSMRAALPTSSRLKITRPTLLPCSGIPTTPYNCPTAGSGRILSGPLRGCTSTPMAQRACSSARAVWLSSSPTASRSATTKATDSDLQKHDKFTR